jgi:hypothetical protein
MVQACRIDFGGRGRTSWLCIVTGATKTLDVDLSAQLGNAAPQLRVSTPFEAPIAP